jgi:hypothetical protein
MEPVTSLIPPITSEQMRKGILYTQQVLHPLKERICVLWDAGSTLESARKALAEINAVPRLPTTLGDDRLLSCGAKIDMDGSGGSPPGALATPNPLAFWCRREFTKREPSIYASPTLAHARSSPPGAATRRLHGRLLILCYPLRRSIGTIVAGKYA